MQQREQVQEFIDTLCGGSKVFYKNISSTGDVYIIDGLDNALSYKDSNIYFLGNIQEESTRTRDNDIGIVTYLRIDVDIKKEYEAVCDGEVCDQGSIIEFISAIESTIKDDPLFGQYSYIVFSGGGCHIYYSNSRGINIKPKAFFAAMKRIYNKFDSLIGEEWLKSDHACGNKARLMRLPGSINQKYGTECAILYRQDAQSDFFKYLKPMAKLQIQEDLEEQKVKEEEFKASHKELLDSSGGQDQDYFYKAINDIPAYLIAQFLVPDFPFDGKKNFRNKSRGLTGYYYVEDKNAICNGGSSYFNWGGPNSCWSNFSLVKKHLSYSNAETFEFFKSKLSTNQQS